MAPALRQHLTAWNERSASVRPEVPTTWLTSFTQSTRSYSLTRSPSCGICEGISILRASSSSFESASIFFLPSEETEAQSYVACPRPCSELRQCWTWNPGPAVPSEVPFLLLLPGQHLRQDDAMCFVLQRGSPSQKEIKFHSSNDYPRTTWP